MHPPNRPNPSTTPDSPATGGRSSAVVGGFPWAAEGTSSPAPFIADAIPPAGKPPPRADAAPLSWAEIKARAARIIDGSPALVASLLLHLLLLIALGVWFVRIERPERLRLSLAFGAASGETGQDEGRDEATEVVEIEPPPSPPPAAEAVAAAPAPAAMPPPPPPAPEPPDEEPSAADTGTADTALAIGAALSGRDPAAREQMLAAGGGSAATESAVARALAWIAKQQKKDGLWSLTGPYGDGGAQENRLAATALALIALQGAGHSPKSGEHAATVARGWKALLRTQADDGTFDAGRLPDQHAMYAHAQATIALCEAYGMTKDPLLAAPARRALGYCIAAQMPDGGWRYQPPQPNEENRGDLSVTGWYLMALKSGEMSGLDVPPAAYEALSRFLDDVFVSEEKGYGYQINPHQKFFDFRPALTAEGLLCRQYLGWRRDDPRLVSGVRLLLREAPIDFDYRRKNVYAWYYATQVCHHMGGAVWAEWNARMQEQLLEHQVETGREKGSWDPANDQWGHVGGRLYVTALCTCMLEVYYRHAPLFAAP